MRTFTVHTREGSQTKSLFLLSSPGQAKAKLSDQPDGDYTIRDCLGGLRMIVRVSGGIVTPVEVTK